MKLFKKFFGFLNRILSYFRKKSGETESPLNTEDELVQDDILEQSEEEDMSMNHEDRINAARRTLLTKLYMLEQEIAVFENDFPEEHKVFTERIEVLRETYNSSLEEISKLLTFEIDPELNTSKSGEVLKLDKDIKRFIQKEVKFHIISKRLQRLITKLNILYNVSIFHSKECEKEKVMSQLKNASETMKEIADEFKECDYILGDRQLKERIVSLLSYADYEVFKTSIRNSNEIPDKLVENLVMVVDFNGFDYTTAFKAFIKDELTDLGDLLSLITDERCSQALRKNLQKLLTLTYSDDAENQIFNSAFWSNFLSLEHCILEVLKDQGVEKDKCKVNLIVGMDISVDESEVIVLPITNAYLSLTSLYSTTQDKRILLLIKMLKNLSNDVTYKEIYFLILLFDVIGVLQRTPNGLIRHIEKYLEKYPYDAHTIVKKKELLINASDKEDYVVVFSLNDYEEDIVTTLEKLDIDFTVLNNNVFINSFYFNDLENVFKSLQTNTENMMI